VRGPEGEGSAAGWRCEITAAFLDAAEPELRAALLLRHDRLAAARDARNRRLLPPLRLLGLGCAGLGILLAGYAIAVIPDAPRTRPALVGYHLAMVFFVTAGVLFWFLPRVTEGLRAWARRAVEGRARKLLAPLRRRAPYLVEYALSGTRLEARAAKLKFRRDTELSACGAALVAPRLACLYRGRDSAWLRRVVYLPEAEARAALLEALRRAGVEVELVEVGPGSETA